MTLFRTVAVTLAALLLLTVVGFFVYGVVAQPDCRKTRSPFCAVYHTDDY